MRWTMAMLNGHACCGVRYVRPRLLVLSPSIANGAATIRYCKCLVGFMFH